jgi:phage major head subunit gpT-like protein
MLPALEEVVMDKYDQYPVVHTKLFQNIRKGEGSIYQTTTVSPAGSMVEIAEGEDVTYEAIKQGYDTTFTYLKYGKGFQITEEAVSDGKFDLTKKTAASLGRAAQEHKEVAAANILNNAFTSGTGGDGSYLCVNDHTLLGGGTESNILATPADLDFPSFDNALVELGDTVDDEGKLLNIKPKYLVVAPAGEVTAREILQSTTRPDTAERAMNALMGKVEVVVWPYLTDADAWFLIGAAEDTGLKAITRQPVKVSSAIDFESDNAKTKLKYRWVVGFDTWQGVFGTPGA